MSEQLALIRRLWKPLLGDSLERFLLIAGEILHEEELAVWMQFNPAAAQARAAAEEAARRRRESGMQQWPSIRQPFGGPRLWRPGSRIRKVQSRHGLDAEHRPDCQEHLCLARAIEQAVWTQNFAT